MRAHSGPVLDRRRLGRAAERSSEVLALLVLDTVSAAISIYAGVIAHSLFRGNDPLPGLAWKAEGAFLPFACVVLWLVFLNAGLYLPRDRRPGGSKIIASLALTTIVVAGFGLSTGVNSIHTGLIYPFIFVCAAVVTPLLRQSFDGVVWLLESAAGRRRRIVICGAGDAARSVAAALRQTRDASLTSIVAVVADVQHVPAALEEMEPTDLILASPPTDAVLAELLDACRASSVRLRVVPTTTTLLARDAVFVAGQGIPLIELVEPTFRGLDYATKKAFDYVISVLLLVLLSPILLLAALAVKLTSPGPILYRDTRIGIGERDFKMLKFRSMRQGAEREQPGLEHRNEGGDVLFKIPDDPRVTRAGRLLRRCSIDELPQLVNVLRGEMSLVGPRPLPPRDYANLNPLQRKRSLVLPGITGLWQTSGRSNLTSDDLVRLDFYYIEHWSIFLDISILARTPLAVVSGRGAY